MRIFKYIAACIFLVLFVACDKDDPVSPDNNTVTDIDGNVYNIVQIGNQWWMAENLRTTRHRNGDPIPTGLNDYEWGECFTMRSAAYAIYSHDGVDGINSDAEMVAAYGMLYNWFAVIDSRGLCPPGWHIPSDAEWKQLEVYLGMSEEEAEKIGWRGTGEGGKLKSTRTEPEPHPMWREPNEGATNESGFSGLPGGYRYPNGSYYLIGFNGFWWSATEDNYSTSYAHCRFLDYVYGYVARLSGFKQFGFSVRCLRDD